MAVSASRRGLRAPRWALAALGVAALALTTLLAPGTTEGAGTTAAPALVKIQISYDGACSPGTLSAQLSADPIPSTGTEIGLTGLVAGCVGTDADPGTVKIDSELFDYANVSTSTAASVAAGQNASGTALAVQSTAGFPAAGQIYVGSELLSYATTTATTFNLSSPFTYAKAHASGSFVRAQGRLKLIARGQATSSPGAGVGATTPAVHNSGAQVRDPITYLTCRGRLSQTTVAGGNDIVSMRSRCYMRLEPAPGGAWPDSPYTTSPDNPSTGPVMGLTPTLYHGTAAGDIADASGGLMTLNTEVFGLTCFPLVQGQLWLKATHVINVDSVKMNNDTGTFSIYTYINDQCSGMAEFVLGGDPGNVTTFEEVAPTTDTDKDGCTDFAELGLSEGLGGKRDPFNPFDYVDINHDGAINVVVDILGVAASFGPGHPRYVDYKDRGQRARAAGSSVISPDDGPSIWNKDKPNGSVDVVLDILGIARQYGHNCPHPTHDTSPFGAHPTAVTAKVTAAQAAPFAMSVLTTAGFPESGQLLVDAETLTYNQNAGTCGGFNPAIQFCITGRGNGTPTGNDPAQHTGFPTGGAVVFQK